MQFTNWILYEIFLHLFIVQQSDVAINSNLKYQDCSRTLTDNFLIFIIVQYSCVDLWAFEVHRKNWLGHGFQVFIQIYFNIFSIVMEFASKNTIYKRELF